jgi:hypothetical protein
MKTAKRVTISILLLCAALTGFACKTTTEPDELKSGSRDYTWKVDTVGNISPDNTYTYLWGTSTSDIWCLGHFGTVAKFILHYDGKKWKAFPNGTAFVDPYAVFGLSAGDFWVGGAESDLWRYQNGSFNKTLLDVPEGMEYSFIQKIWGTKPDDLYAVGGTVSKISGTINGIIMHYDGANWKYICNPEKDVQFLAFKKVTGENNKFYLTAYKRSQQDSIGIYEFDGSNFKRIYFDVYNLRNSPAIAYLSNKLLFAFKEKVYTYDAGQFKEYIDLSNQNIYTMTRFSGRSEYDFFLCMNDGVGHYNGTNLVTLYKCNTGTVIYDILYLEKDIYFLCYDQTAKLYFIVHGTEK